MTKLALSELTLSHFRSHKRAVLDLEPRPMAIFGPNGAGKTNLLEAVSLLSPGRGLRRAGADDLTRRPEALGWKVTAQLQSLHQTHELETWAEAGSPRQLRIDGKAAPQTALGRIARILWLVPSMDRLWIEGADGRRRFLDRATLSFEPLHAEAVLTYEKAMRERNRLLKDMVRDPHWYTAIEAQMAEAGAAIQTNRQRAITELTTAQEAATTAFPTATLALTSAEPIPDDLQTALADSRNRDMAAGRTLIGPHRADLDAVFADKGVPAKDCSTGEQ
jgi:DNA replication and repair protein RecF